MKNYIYSIVSTTYMVFLVVEDTDTWECAILDWDLYSEEDIEEAVNQFKSGLKDLYEDEEGVVWHASIYEFCDTVTSVRNLYL